MTAVYTENLLPEPSSDAALVGDVTASSETAVMDLAVDNILSEASKAEGEASYTLPTTSSADLFGGELGEYELNEIPSLFNLDAQQMSADLETLGFSTTEPETASTETSSEIPFITTSAAVVPTTAALVSATDSEGESNTTENVIKEPKRSAAEISEDEESRPTKARRVTLVSEPPASTISTPQAAPVPVTPPPSAASKRPLAPKPASQKINIVDNPDASRQIDTSTAHIKALTGAKGAAMCFEIVSGTERDTTVAIPNLASTDLSPEEKAKFSRDRNRLHARNTRIRKKAYVDELKRTLDVLVQERDGAAEAKIRKVNVEREERSVRFSVLEEFLRMRGRNERAPARWSAILEEQATLHLPNLDFHQEGGAGKKVATGVAELMQECDDFARKIQTGTKGLAAPPAPAPPATGLLNFQCDRESLLMEGSSVVLDWTATSTDPARADMLMRGTCRAAFNPQSNRLRAVELFFDSSSLMA